MIFFRLSKALPPLSHLIGGRSAAAPVVLAWTRQRRRGPETFSPSAALPKGNGDSRQLSNFLDPTRRFPWTERLRDGHFDLFPGQS